jgi:branched-chain amino acid transport system ATP-binding protein
MSTLTVNGLHTGYGPVDALHGINLSTAGAGICAILGPNGSGKTTLIRSITGQLPLRQGTVLLDDTPISGQPSHAIAHLGVATVPQGRGIFGELSVAENLAMGGYVLQDESLFEERLAVMYDRFPILKERSAQAAGSLSGGEQMMLAVARAMLSDPRLLILDEPSEGLAPKLVQQVFNDIFQYVHRDGGRVVLVEQNVRQTLAIADRVFVLVQGRIVASGTPDDFGSTEDLMDLYLAGRSSRH